MVILTPNLGFVSWPSRGAQKSTGALRFAACAANAAILQLDSLSRVSRASDAGPGLSGQTCGSPLSKNAQSVSLRPSARVKPKPRWRLCAGGRGRSVGTGS